MHSVVREFVSFNKQSLSPKFIKDVPLFRIVGEEVIKTQSEGMFSNKSSSSHNNNHKQKNEDNSIIEIRTRNLIRIKTKLKMRLK